MKIKSNNIFLLFLFVLLLLPSSALAFEWPEVPNPIPDFANIQDLIWTVVNWALGFAGLVSVVFLILGGFTYITAAGNEEQAKKATKTLTYAVIGLVLILAAYAIKTTIIQVLT